MSVKSSQSGARMLTVLETIAEHQPIGASALARLLEEDKSAVQRAVVTLANAGWIRPTIEPQVRWELSAHLFTLAHLPSSSTDLRERARRSLEELRDESGETTILAIPDLSRFVVIEVIESRHILRTAPRIGELIPVEGSATGSILLSHYSPEKQIAMLGRKPSAEEVEQFDLARRRGFGVSAGNIIDGATTIAAPVLDATGQPIAAMIITGPSDRLPPERYEAIGDMVRRAIAGLSRRPARAA